MKMRFILSILLIILLINIASAEIMYNQQPENLYNMGETIKIPLKVVTSQNLDNFLIAALICDGSETEILKQFISLSSGEEQEITITIPLVQTFTGKTNGKCKIKSTIGEEYLLSNEFEISNILTIELREITEKEFAPEESIGIEGSVSKQNQKEVNGFVDITLTNGEETISMQNTIKKGYFLLNFSLPKNAKAGTYSVKVRAYEKDFNEQETNTGESISAIQIKQIPTNLELLLESYEITPGTNVKITPILHDQTGEKIAAAVIASIKNQNDKIILQEEIQTDETLEYSIANNIAPAQWTIYAISNKLESEIEFTILEKYSVDIEILNKTVTITNTGNVHYNKTAAVKIGEETVEIETELDVGESKKYLLSAPDGQYQVEILTENGNQASGSMHLTGDAINAREISSGVLGVIKHPISWIFLIIILIIIIYLIFKKGYQKTFFGFMKSKKQKPMPVRKDSTIKPRESTAEISLSIKGNKQDASVVCLQIKNIKDIEKNKEATQGPIQEIINFANERKTAIYKNQENIFFILTPEKTKTFENEKTALEIAQKAKATLDEYNKMAKQKIKYGISLNYGTIIAKHDPQTQILKFMSMGTLITGAKKIASISNKDIFLSETMNKKMSPILKTKKYRKNKPTVYTIQEIKNTEGHSKFLKSFLNRMDSEEQKNKQEKK